MTANLLQLIQDEIGSSNMQQIGSQLGESSSATQSALTKGVAALLAALLGKASTAGGARALMSELSDADDGILDNIAGFLSGDRQEAAGQGSRMISRLLGDDANGVADSIARASGIKSGAASSLLGMLAPMVGGFLSRYVRTHGLDASGLTKLLGDQRGLLQGALPSSLAGLFGTEGIQDAIESVPSSIAQAASSSFSWRQLAVPALLGLAVLGIGYWLIADRDELPAVSARPPAASLATLDGAISDVTTALTQVRDESSARIATQSIERATRSLDAIADGFPQLSPEARSSLARRSEDLKTALSSAAAAPGAGEVLRPAMRDFQVQLARLVR